MGCAETKTVGSDVGGMAKRGQGTRITRLQVMKLLEQQEYKCALTGWDLTPRTASLDHVVPLSRDGPHTIENAQIVDHRVNRAKGSLSNVEFIELCCAVATRHSSRSLVLEI